MSDHYRNQMELLIQVLPHVAEEKVFALHGGTAINLFIRDMPRYSVDIDLTYLPVEDRPTSMGNIGSALERIGERIRRAHEHVHAKHQQDKGKLIVEQNDVGIKLEVNLVKRGTLDAPASHALCGKAQEEFSAFVEMPLVSLGQLYGGKICAALDRQHPRDLFDVKVLLASEGYTESVRVGFIFGLLGANRPIHEILAPNLLDQRQSMDNSFAGMSLEPFTYEDFESTRRQLIDVVREGMTDEDKSFLLSVKNCDPDWGIYDFEKYPSMQWKLLNLRKLMKTDPDKHKLQLNALKEKLGV